ncbi:MAG: LPS export ABC transporter permease LptF [Desulfamplus sp.]|nr:LPS export ABC transporter permease LptF [Desulfamplus sp.]MBF0412991.1 LPS export ABC transporter permease LptF [Desulfamplus sp.]
MPSILSRYIFKELLSPFSVSITFLTFIFLMTRIPEITNMVVNYNTGIASLVMLIIYTIPRFMEFTIPMSVMISVLLTAMRMSNDNEIIALKGSGISLSRLVLPVMLFCTLGTILSLWITIWGVPWGRFSFAVTGAELAKSTLNLALKERQFNNTFEGVMIYITSIDIKTSEFSDIFIEDSRNPNSVNITTASKGVIVSDDSGYNHTFRLFKGTINQVDIKARSVNALSFDTYDINFDTQFGKQDLEKQGKDYDEMYLYELLDFIQSGKVDSKELRSAIIELHEKFAIPFSCLALGLLALPLGISSGPSSKRSSGFGLALSFSLCYYLLLAAARSVGETEHYSPVIGIWLPDIIMGVTAIYMFSRVSQEKSLIFLPFWSKLILLLRIR